MTAPEITLITGERLPKPAGPYSPATRAGGLVFVSGQVGVDPATGKTPEGVAAQTDQVLRNVAAILEAAGSGLDRVVRCGVFVDDMARFAEMNEVYQRHFGDHRPARTTIEPRSLPGSGFLVEIDAVAVAGS